MAAAFGGLTHTVRAGSMEEAVPLAAAVTAAGGTVLLSPGCSSFDMFKSYEERGQVFSAAVRPLAGVAGMSEKPCSATTRIRLDLLLLAVVLTASAWSWSSPRRRSWPSAERYQKMTSTFSNARGSSQASASS